MSKFANVDGLPEAVRAHLDDLPREKNWNSYGADPPTDAAKDAAYTVLRFLAICPTNDGGVQIETHALGYDVEIEITPEGKLDSLLWAKA